ncbi:MAG: AbrB/MazE/SpoVT family DNA-binding domain-containing protein [Spirochaetota bacterium]|nr:AbrB/MazE/SpoVT family DNA-binding domain-containing protein [Spirochaetota bacterium]
MKTKIIKIGNSKGIRIPKSILEQTNLNNEVELEIIGDHIVIRPICKKYRLGWESNFKKMTKDKDDYLLDNDNLININTWDQDNWEW